VDGHGRETMEPWTLRSLALPITAPRKEVIQPQVPLRLPCYDLTPIIAQTLAACLRS
jgi:hypothetical protein